MMKKESIVIIGAVRNGEIFLKNLFKNIYQITSYFEKYKIILFENDSTDQTRTLLQSYVNKDLNITLLLEDNLDKKYKYRTERLAYVRNKLLDHVLLYYSNYTYLLNMDMDDVNTTPQIAETFHEIFSYDPSLWDVQTIHQTKEYYDIWAFRKRGYIEYDCWLEVRKDISKGISYDIAHQNHVTKYQKPYTLRRGLIPVISAFGGAAIYKIAKLGGREKYVGLNEYGEVCEHVSFHKTLLNDYGLKICINPLWINKE
jgi:hypothetical protein